MLEMIKIKCSEILKHINNNAQVIFCLDICCEVLNIPFCEPSLAEQYSCQKKSAYKKNRKILLKVLDLNKKMTIDDVIRKLGITNSSAVEKMAKEIFKTYMTQQAYENQDIDPSVFVMSVYFACKFENVKIAKKNVLNLSNLTHSQWGTMEKSWDKWTTSINSKKQSKTSKTESIKENVPVETMDTQETQQVSKKLESFEEPYDVWAKRILEKAYAELKAKK